MYLLSEKALNKLRTRKADIIPLLSLALSRDAGSIKRYIQDNEVNGDLTKFAALEILRQELGLTDSQLLRAVKKETAKLMTTS